MKEKGPSGYEAYTPIVRKSLEVGTVVTGNILVSVIKANKSTAELIVDHVKMKRYVARHKK